MRKILCLVMLAGALAVGGVAVAQNDEQKAAIKRLIELQIVIQGPNAGKSNTYMLNPACCFFGKLGSGVKARKEAIEDGKAKIINFNKNDNV